MATLPKEAVKGLISKAQALGQSRAENIKKQAMVLLLEDVENEKHRLETLQKRGAIIGEDDFLFLSSKLEESKRLINETSMALDALRLVF